MMIEQLLSFTNILLLFAKFITIIFSETRQPSKMEKLIKEFLRNFEFNFIAIFSVLSMGKLNNMFSI